MTMSPSDLDATELAARIAVGELTAREAVSSSLGRIALLDGQLAALVTVDAEGAFAAADEADRLRASAPHSRLPPLLGVPIAVKDLTDTKGLRTTHGSDLCRDNIPGEDALSVERMRAAGAIIIGKTNTPEFGFGAVCTNRLCGPTRNPWNPALTSGGSSGGSAVAVATGMVPIALGTDFGGSVRTPASFCGCLSLRPTPGRIPEPKRILARSTLASQGVMARSTADIELALQVLAGPERCDPVSHLPAAEPAPARLRLAVSTDLGGAFPVDAAVATAFAEAVDILGRVLGDSEEKAPDVRGGIEAFKTLRAAESWFNFGSLVETHSDRLTPSFVWNVREGRDISAAEYLAAEAERSAVYRNFVNFFSDVDLLALPSAPVLPFSNEQEDVLEVGGRKMESIIDYLACTFLISLVGFPVLNFPICWTAEDLPFGIQLVARPGQEALLFNAARRLEAAGFGHRWPPVSGGRMS
ncbi:MAG: amidase [Oricola sp.]